MRDKDIIEGFDAFNADMAAHQLQQGELPTGDANRRLAADVYREMDNNGANEAAIEVNRANDAAIALPTSADWTVTKQDDTDEPERKVEPVAARMLKRLRFLLNQHDSVMGRVSWHERAMAVQRLWPMRRGPNFDALMRRYSFELTKLLAESDRYFGSWKLDFAPDPYASQDITWSTKQ